ncbi:g5704 [Coccomyxa elongata]
MARNRSSLSVPLVSIPATDLPGGEDPEVAGSHLESFGFPARNSAASETSTSYLDDEADIIPQRRHMGSVFWGLFQRGNDLEGAGVNHYYTREERARLADVESIDYLPPNSEVYRRWLTGQPHRRQWDRWFMMGSIGVTVGLIGYFLFFFIELLSDAKYRTVRFLVGHTNIGVAWLFNMAYSIALVFGSSWMVVNWAPQAAGAGVAEVMAYLNGCMLPHVFNVQTLIVKFFSCVLAVGSGLPVGPEGPMVHIGAMIGAALSQGHSTTLGFTTGLFRRFQNPKDKRDFVTAGTAVGIATAFGAPIGGLLFAFEELANSFSQTLGWQIFFACMVAVLTLDTFKSAQHALNKGHFGLFDGDASTVFFEVLTPLTNHVAAVAPAAVIGVACGLLAIAFTVINLKVARLRIALLQARKGWRMAEPCILMGLFVTAGMLLPLAFPCRASQCVIEQGATKPICPPGTAQHVQRIVEQSLELYTCSAASADSEMPPAQRHNATVPTTYNELATLMSVTGEDAIKHLLSRGTHREFGYAALIVMLVVYFGGAVWAAGSAISSGLFVPMLLIGSCIGRIVGLIAVDVAAAGGHGSANAPLGVFLPPSPWSWVDPGAFALIGAGAFMGGVTRLTISLAVIMMEVSNDVRMLLPLLIGILAAKWVADAATHSLYHGLLEVKCVPWLPSVPVAKKALDLVPVRAAMAAPAVTLHEHMRLEDIRHVLRDARHNGFPVVRDSPSGQVLVGLVNREHLMVVMRRALAAGPRLTGELPEVPYEELNRNYVSAAARSLISEQQLAVLQGHGVDGLHMDGAAFERVLDLTPYINTSAPAVPETFSLERAYMMFRQLGLRHLVVVDQHNHVKGIVTRKDLLGYRLDDAVDRARTSKGFISPSASTGRLRPRGASTASSVDGAFL